VADQLTVGSLLAAVARPSPEVLQRVCALCRPAATLTVVLALDATRDHAELLRRGLPSVRHGGLASHLASGYAEAGFTLSSVRPLDSGNLARWPTAWARRLASASTRTFIQIDAVASPNS
jgi:hypothetical protein